MAMVMVMMMMMATVVYFFWTVVLFTLFLLFFSQGRVHCKAPKTDSRLKREMKPLVFLCCRRRHKQEGKRRGRKREFYASGEGGAIRVDT